MSRASAPNSTLAERPIIPTASFPPNAIARTLLVVGVFGFAPDSALGAQSPVPGPFVHQAWTSQDGLPQMSAYAIQQTRDGYLWIATLQGLVRFDGHRFVLFSASDHPGLPGERLVALVEDATGDLWISTQAQGLARYRDGRFRTFTVADGLPSNAAGPSAALVAARDGGVWVGSDRGVARIRADSAAGDRFAPVPGQQALPSTVVTTVLEEADGRLWLGTNVGLVTRPDERSAWKHYGAEHGLPESSIGVVQRDRGGVLWVGTADGVARLNPDTDRFESFAMPGDRVVALVEDRAGTLWAGSAGGGLRYFDGSAFIPYGVDDIGTSVVELFEDDEGSLWIGTNGNGLHRLKRSLFTSLGSSPTEALGPMTHGVIEDRNGTVWAATYEFGLLRFDGSGRGSGNGGGAGGGGGGRSYGPDRGIQTPTIWSVAESSDGQIWVGAETGLFRFRPDLDRFDPVDIDQAPELSEQRIAAITPTDDGSLWVGTFLSGLFRFRPDRPEAAERVVEPASLPLGGAILDVLPARDGSIWVGTQTGGLLRLHDGRRSFYLDQPPIPAIRTLVERPSGAIWIGTYGRGLCDWSPQRNDVRCLDTSSGLPANTVHAVQDDGLGFLWVSSNTGLFRLRLAEVEGFFAGNASPVRADVFTRSDGLPDTEFNGGFQPTSWATGDGRLLFPSTNGLAVVDPSRVTAVEQRPPRMHVEAVVVDGTSSPIEGGMRVPAGTERLAFGFTGIRLSDPEALRIEYRLDGYDPEGTWVASGPGRTATYTSLPPGSYRFRVRGAVGRGSWSEAGLDLTLPPLFHQTGWFLTLVTVGLAALIVLGTATVSRARFERRLARVRALQALEVERARISRDMHDEVGASLTEIAILSEIAQTAPHARGQEMVERMGTKARRTLDAIGEIIWAISPVNDDGDRFSAYLREHAAESAEAAGLTAHLEFPPAGVVPDVGAEVRRAVLLVLKESLVNVAKHARASRVQVRFAVVGGALDLEVCDDGRAEAADTPRFPAGGRGLENMTDRALELGGHFEHGPKAGGGWRVRMVLPLPTAGEGPR